MKIEETIVKLIREFFKEAKNQTIDELLNILHPDVKVSQITQNYFVVIKKFAPGYIIVSDLASILYCERKFWFMYNFVKKYRYSINIVDRNGLERILRGLYVHKQLAQTLSKVMMTEVEVIDYSTGLAGRIDGLKIENEFDGQVYEFKVTYRSKIYESWVAQLALYAYLVENVLKLNIDRGTIVTANGYIKLKISETLMNTAKELIEIGRKILRSKEPPEVKTRKKEKCKACGFNLICFRL